jgi:hypothetical protein
MTIALIITLTLLVFLIFLRTQGRLLYYYKGDLVRGEDGGVLGIPQFRWKIDNGFICRLVGLQVEEDDFALPVYKPIISFSWGEGLFVIETGALVWIFEKALPFIHLVWDTGDRRGRVVSDDE